MARSLWKGPFCEITFKDLKIWSRRSMVLPRFIGKNFFIYNGKNFLSIKVTEEMVGHKFGEFANSRKKAIHKKKIKNKRGK